MARPVKHEQLSLKKARICQKNPIFANKYLLTLIFLKLIHYEKYISDFIGCGR